MEDKTPTDKRRYVRFDVQTKVNFQVKGKREGAAPSEKVSGVSKNVSVEGICFRTDKELAAGTELELEVFLPSEPEPLLLRGEVRWSHPIQSGEGKTIFEIGVNLSTISESGEGRFMGYVCDKMTERLSRYLHL